MSATLHPFIRDCIEQGSTVHTDGWQGYKGLDQLGYDHEVTVLRGRKDASKLLPRDHAASAYLKFIYWISRTTSALAASRGE